MSFLDNLENNLKNLESRDEQGSSFAREQDRKAADRARGRAAAPYVEQLRRGPFTPELLAEATRIGHGLRVKVYITWLDNTLRLEAREHRLELKPTSEGVVAQFYVDRRQTATEVIDLSRASAKELAERWLSPVTQKTQVTGRD
jgi:hypothetical protein